MTRESEDPHVENRSLCTPAPAQHQENVPRKHKNSPENDKRTESADLKFYEHRTHIVQQ